MVATVGLDFASRASGQSAHPVLLAILGSYLYGVGLRFFCSQNTNNENTSGFLQAILCALLIHVPKRDRPVAHGGQLLLGVQAICALAHLPVALVVDAAVRQHEEDGRDGAHADEAQLERMAQNESWLVFFAVKV